MQVELLFGATGGFLGTYLRWCSSPVAPNLLSKFPPPLFTFSSLLNSQSLKLFLHLFDKKEREDLGLLIYQSKSPSLSFLSEVRHFASRSEVIGCYTPLFLSPQLISLRHLLLWMKSSWKRSLSIRSLSLHVLHWFEPYMVIH
jgi:hypothetical protein